MPNPCVHLLRVCSSVVSSVRLSSGRSRVQVSSYPPLSNRFGRSSLKSNRFKRIVSDPVGEVTMANSQRQQSQRQPDYPGENLCV